ncbi:MAG: bifunctional aconitate hydratase 2/2-methylisocitrate dehydratase [bacterium]|nr:bifunctional aconitate hydratase 2/2-methylisocitrate dehydratase [bacterium]
MNMLDKYRKDEAERLSQGIPALPLDADQVEQVVALLQDESADTPLLLDLLANRVEPGVSAAARVKAEWLESVAGGALSTKALGPKEAVAMLGSMGGGYNVAALLRLLDNKDAAALAAEALKGIIKVYEAFDEVAQKAKSNPHAEAVLKSWAQAEWFTQSAALPEQMELQVYKVDGEINTDDLSPGNQAQSRADIPLHATFFGYKRFPGGVEALAQLRKSGIKAAFAGDVMGTGSSRKSAINSLAWHIGEDMPGSPNKRRGGLVLGTVIAPIFYATARDAGVLPLECEVEQLKSGERIILELPSLKLHKEDGTPVAVQPPPVTLLDEYRAGGRLNLIIGRNLTRAACKALDVAEPDCFAEAAGPQPKPGQKYTLAQKMLGRACGLEGVVPGMLCEPVISTVGSQDTTGPMTVQELEELACLRFKTDLYMQSYCHTAAYPKKGDLLRWQTLEQAAVSRGGVSLKPGDGVIHPWINRMLIPDTVGTGGDSHTRFPLGISFPAGSGLVAFAAALGFMPLEVPPSVLVRFKGKRRPGITVRDMVNAIPYFAVQEGLLTVAKKGKKNIFAGAILEIEGVDDLRVEEAFELSDASAERSAAACAMALPLAAVQTNVAENVELLKSLVADGYEDAEALKRRIAAMEAWLAAPSLLERDQGAEYAAVLEIDLAELTEPLVACPNDPDDVRPLSAVAGAAIDEVFIGSCMTHLSHLKRVARLMDGASYAACRVWIAPSTRMDEKAMQEEGGFSIFGQVGCRLETPGCSLCMGNQARVKPGATVMSTSTRNFDNRLGDGSQVYLASSELTAITGLLGKIPTPDEYMEWINDKLQA